MRLLILNMQLHWMPWLLVAPYWWTHCLKSFNYTFKSYLHSVNKKHRDNCVTGSSRAKVWLSLLGWMCEWVLRVECVTESLEQTYYWIFQGKCMNESSGLNMWLNPLGWTCDWGFRQMCDWVLRNELVTDFWVKRVTEINIRQSSRGMLVWKTQGLMCHWLTESFLIVDLWLLTLVNFSFSLNTGHYVEH